ncbi:urokinase plasminogen activator surface receptor-like [Clarias gariepinus]|uniref:phospholipase A2 inhibitor and Ly6/PLAUR domain-containing protein-like n=1 Tax=Clarias gariepinus TaxID=13013 RepID=UPI00234E154D|nr:phospholipase A2 inhibitor and Ly6/PLAUR domain-containing protein-like [Clarias gariepinus]
MKSQVTLLLNYVLFCKALSLTCHHCPLSAPGKCGHFNTTCFYQCLTATNVVSIHGTKVTEVIKTCGFPKMCVNGSLNLGTVKVTTHAKCCRRKFCNKEELQALPEEGFSTNRCYICDGAGCSNTVRCAANEDRCIIASVGKGSNFVAMKGCVSKSLCLATGTSSLPGIGLSNVQCCEGNLCNGAQIFTQSFLLIMVHLLFSIFFY